MQPATHNGTCDNKLMIRQGRLGEQLLGTIEQGILNPPTLDKLIARCEDKLRKRRQAKPIEAIETAGDMVSVVRRREEIGILRALGATSWGVVGAFLLEAAYLGLAGGIGGVGLGRLMASGSVGLVAATVDSLYVSSTPAPIALTPAAALGGIAIGVLLSLVSALAPAWEASQVLPVEAMARGRRDHDVRMHQRRNVALSAGLAAAALFASGQPPIGNEDARLEANRSVNMAQSRESRGVHRRSLSTLPFPGGRRHHFRG